MVNNIESVNPVLSPHADTGAVARAVVDARASEDISVYKRGDFILASGVKSDVYYNFRAFSGFPALSKIIVEQLASAITPYDPDVIVTKELGGVFWAPAVSYVTGIPYAVVRKPKEHGTKAKLEGHVTDLNCMALEDVNTTLASISDIVDNILEFGGNPISAIAIMDRGEYEPKKLYDLQKHIRNTYPDSNFELECLVDKFVIDDVFDACGGVNNPHLMKPTGRKVAPLE